VHAVTEEISTPERYRRWALFEARGTSPVYERLALAVAEHPPTVDLLARVDGPQRQPNLFFGALRWFEAPVEDPDAALAWAVGHPTEVLGILTTRRTQTNEATRCAALLPALAVVAAQQDRPLALVELGSSAGLCLLYDRYAYAYRAEDGTVQRVGPADSRLELRCDLSGPVPVLHRVPSIAWRAGVDLAPIDPGDPDARRWLGCLVWPEHTDRAEVLAAAMDLAASDPPRMVRAGFVQGLVQLLREVPPGTTPVVVHSAALAYAPPQVREQVLRICTEAGARRVGAEGRSVLPSVAQLAPAADPGKADLLISIDDRAVAAMHPHGRWLHWF